MRERPILYSGPMVRATLSGQKRMTRSTRGLEFYSRPENDPDGWRCARVVDGVAYMVYKNTPQERVEKCPFGQPGDCLYVRESFMDLLGTGVEHRDTEGRRQRYAYAADCPPGSWSDETRKDYGLKWKPSIHMPRAASRITLEITGVRVERLLDTSEADALAEGVTVEDHHRRGYCAGESPPPAMRAFRELWESINGAGAWDANPWVWVVEFRRLADG